MDTSIDFEYYYNNVPEKGLCRNNLIYTSLVNKDKTMFCKWYHNDTQYHQGMNEVVDIAKMQEKWERELKYFTIMQEHYPQHVPNIIEIDRENKKIFFEIQGADMWEQAGCTGLDYTSVLRDWQDQMLEILQAHKDLGLYKYSLHPSSYFVVDGKLKSINYFFTYHKNEQKINVRSHLSHISHSRREKLFPQMEAMGIDLDAPQEWNKLQILCFESFSNNYSRDFIDKAVSLYV